MKRILYAVAVASLFAAGSAHADPAPGPTTIPALAQPMTSHDGSWFAQVLDEGSGYSDPVVTSADGTVQMGMFRELTNEDLDAIASSIALWQPAEVLPAGEYTIAFEGQSGTLQVDPELDLAVAFGDAMAGTEYLPTRNGEAVGGTSCCAIEGCSGNTCVDCWPRYNFLSATTTLAIPTFPNSLALRVQRTAEQAVVLVAGPQVTVHTGFDVDEVCIGVDVVDATFVTLQGEERCATTEDPSEDELTREQPVPDTCVGDPCVRIASEFDGAQEDCPDDLGVQPEPVPGEEGADNGSKSSPGCGCASTGDVSPGWVLLVIGVLGLRLRRSPRL